MKVEGPIPSLGSKNLIYPKPTGSILTFLSIFDKISTSDQKFIKGEINLMAKSEKRVKIAFVCTVCKTQTYITEKSKINEQGVKISLKKYCPNCKKHTEHKETEKLGKNK